MNELGVWVLLAIGLVLGVATLPFDPKEKRWLHVVLHVGAFIFLWPVLVLVAIPMAIRWYVRRGRS